MWWFGWRHFARMKDEALTPQGYRIEQLPIAAADDTTANAAASAVTLLCTISKEKHEARATLREWLSVNWNLQPAATLADPFNLTADEFTAAIRSALPRAQRTLSSAAIAAIRAEHAATIAPVAVRLAEAARLEATLSEMVNRAYGLTAEDEALIWETAPPRMPIARPQLDDNQQSAEISQIDR